MLEKENEFVSRDEHTEELKELSFSLHIFILFLVSMLSIEDQKFIVSFQKNIKSVWTHLIRLFTSKTSLHAPADMKIGFFVYVLSSCDFICTSFIHFFH